MSMIPSFFARRPNVFHPFSDEVWDPFQGWPLRFPFDQGSSSGLPSSTASFARAQVDWKETPTAHVFQADVPGLRMEEVKVEVEEGRILKIRGERKLEQERRSDTWHHVERSSGRFARRFRLPKNAKVDQLKATIENGVLTVTVPKQPPPKKAVVRSIEISG